VDYNIRAMDSITYGTECLKKKDDNYFISDYPRLKERFLVKLVPPDRIKNILIGKERNSQIR